jgi:hypothetical protein
MWEEVTIAINVQDLITIYKKRKILQKEFNKKMRKRLKRSLENINN